MYISIWFPYVPSSIYCQVGFLRWLHTLQQSLSMSLSALLPGGESCRCYRVLAARGIENREKNRVVFPLLSVVLGDRCFVLLLLLLFRRVGCVWIFCTMMTIRNEEEKRQNLCLWKNRSLKINEKRKTEPWIKFLIIDWRRYRWGYRLLRNLCMQR